MDYQFFQEYWWLLISVLGALLVFMLFVQGGQSMILQMKENQREDMIYSIAHRWELTFTVLVTFGGAFFASFPLFYSTSFGGAYWIWMLILFGFVVQAVSFKYRLAEGNILGRKTYDIFLFLNGILAPVLLGGAVSTFFFGSDFTVEKTNLTDASAPVISQWGDWHGLEALLDWRVVIFGIMVLFLTRVLANLWFLNQVKDKQTDEWNRKQLMINAPVFVILFLAIVATLLTRHARSPCMLPRGNPPGALCHLCSSCKEKPQRNMVRRHRYGTCSTFPLLGGRLQQHSLLPLLCQYRVIADHIQFLIIRVYTKDNEYCQYCHPFRAGIHLMGMV